MGHNNEKSMLRRLKRKHTIEPEPLKVAVKCRKKPLPTREVAEGVENSLYAKNRRQKKNRGKLNVYFCTTCDAWHVGHKPKRGAFKKNPSFRVTASNI